MMSLSGLQVLYSTLFFSRCLGGTRDVAVNHHGEISDTPGQTTIYGEFAYSPERQRDTAWTSAGPDHVRSSSGTAAVPRAASPQAPARVSTNNPFHRASGGGNFTHGQWSVAANQTVVGNDGMPGVRSQVPVQHDPLR
ncbi:hypothetical protein V8E55_010858 [Tylopilus felleus]